MSINKKALEIDAKIISPHNKIFHHSQKTLSPPNFPMKLKYHNDYYKVLDSEIPPNYQDLVNMLPEIISPEPLPPVYHLRYRDLEEFPIKVSNQRSYKVMLEEKKKSQGEIILFITTDDQDEDFRDSNSNIRTMGYDSQANHIPPFPSMSFSGSNQYQPLARNPLVLGMKKEEANIFPMMNSNSPPTTVDEAIGNNHQGDISKRFLPGGFELPFNKTSGEDKAMKDVKLVASVLDALNEIIPEKNEKVEKKKTKKKKVESEDEDENKGPHLRSADSKENKKKGDSSRKNSADKSGKKKNHPRPKSTDGDEENLEVLAKKLKHSASSVFPLRSTGENRIEAKHLKPIQSGNLFIRVKEMKEKWRDDCLIEIDLNQKSVKINSVLRPNPRAVGFQFNKSITDEKMKLVMKDLLDVLKGNNENMKTISMDLRNCHSLSKIGIITIFQNLNQHFKQVETIDMDFSYDRHRHKFTPLPGKISLDLPNLERLNVCLRLRPDINNNEIFEFIKGVQKSSRDIEDVKVIRPLWPESTKFASTADDE